MDEILKIADKADAELVRTGFSSLERQLVGATVILRTTDMGAKLTLPTSDSLSRRQPFPLMCPVLGNRLKQRRQRHDRRSLPI